MPVDLSDKLIVAISSRALFDLEESHQIFENDGEAAYANSQLANEDNILNPGPAYNLVTKLLNLKEPTKGERLVEVILLSRNNADTGLRIFNSIQHHNLSITRAAFTRGESPYRYVKAFNAHLFLSSHAEDVRAALKSDCAAATIFTVGQRDNDQTQLRIAFDGDSVIFSDEAERIYQEQDLATFQEHEQADAKKPLRGGPFKTFLQQLHLLQQHFPPESSPIRTALITARNAPAHERAIRTLRSWNIRTDEALFLGGLSKGDFLNAFAADIFFDDQKVHCESAGQHVTTGHVPHGVSNEA